MADESFPPFKPIYDRAVEMKGGDAALKALLPEVKSPTDLAKIGDDRWLSDMSKRVFQAGFNWSVIEKKWPGFEAAFHGFDPHRCAMIHDEEMDTLLADTRIVRNGQKIDTVRQNATFLLELARDHGSAARAFADWPSTDYIGLLALLKKRGARLGGSTAQYFLRGMGKDSLMTTRDVTAALIREGVIDKAPSGQRAMKTVQAACNQWMKETGLPLSHISRILAATIDTPHPGRDRTPL